MLGNNRGAPSKTKCRMIPVGEMKVHFRPENPMATTHADCSDGTVLDPNILFMYHRGPAQRGSRYFLMDRRDQVRMTRIWRRCKDINEKDEKNDDLLYSLAKFTRNYKKTIYVRMYPPSKRDTIGLAHDNRVFTEEILEIIPVALRQQSCPFDERDPRLMHYRKLWDPNSNWSYNTVDVTTFEAVLDEFGVDKSFVVLVHDPVYGMNRVIKYRNEATLVVFAPDLTIVFNLHEAIDCVFTNVIMRVNWSTDKCPHHDFCNQNLKGKVTDLMTTLQNIPEEAMIHSGATIDAINIVRRFCSFNFETKCVFKQENVKQEDLKPAQTDIPLEDYHILSEEFDLPVYKNFIDKSNKATLPIWMHRMFLKLGWIQQFFRDGNHDSIRQIMIENLIFTLPTPVRELGKMFIDSVLRGNEFLPTYGFYQIPGDEKVVEECSDSSSDDDCTALAAAIGEKLVIQPKAKKAPKKKKTKKNKKK